MPMTKCRECQGDVSSEANKCPKCGIDTPDLAILQGRSKQRKLRVKAVSTVLLLALSVGSFYAYKTIRDRQVEKIIDQYTYLISQNPNDQYNYFKLGNLLHEYGRLTEAENTYRILIEKFPQEEDAYNSLMVTLRAAGKDDEMNKLYDQAKSMLDPSDKDAQELLHLWAISLGRQ